jgi:hypothetical protein
LLGVCFLAGAVLAWPMTVAAEPAGPNVVTLVWHCAGTADIYINGKAVNNVKPDFLTRTKATKEYSARVELKVGDVITVGARRTKGSGFRLIALDSAKQLVWQTESYNWRTYGFRDLRSAKRWYQPSVVAHARMMPVSVPAKDPEPPDQFEKPRSVLADYIWFGDAEMVFLACKITERRNLVRLPLLAMAHVGTVQYWANDTQLDGLQPDDLDGSNRIKSYKQPLRYTLVFDPPVEVSGTVVSLADPTGSFLWQVECADNKEDLAARKGAYRAATKPQQSPANQALDLRWEPIKAAWWQLSARKESGEETNISLRKFELLVPAKR